MSVLSDFVSGQRAARQFGSVRRAIGSIPAGGARSPLTRRIIFFNAVALIILIGGVLLVESSRVGLVEERLSSMKQQGMIVASTLAEYATSENRYAIDVDRAEPLLRQLLAPTQLRARLYGTDGKLAIDTRNLLARNVVQVVELPPILVIS